MMSQDFPAASVSLQSQVTATEQAFPPKSAQHSLWTETEVAPASCVTVPFNPLTLRWGPHFLPLG